MWTIIKFDKKKIGSFNQDLKLKLGNDYKIYHPKLLIEKFQKNKIIKKEFSLLGDYIFCFHNKFCNKEVIDQIRYFKGVKHLLEGFNNSQEEISKFIAKCKEIENKEGYITENIFKIEINKFYKFSSGPFTDKIFQLINLRKNKLSIVMGNIKTIINKKEFLFNPI